jgi:hypothetical protein
MDYHVFSFKGIVMELVKPSQRQLASFSEAEGTPNAAKKVLHCVHVRLWGFSCPKNLKISDLTSLFAHFQSGHLVC